MSYPWVGSPTPFNGTNTEDGGNSSSENLNQWFQAGDTAFILASSFLIMLMPPGLGILYSGLSRRRSGLSLILVTAGAFSVITFQWFFWGYSLAFSRTGKSGFIGDLQHFGLMNTLAVPSQGSPLISELLYSFFQMMFCATTAAIVAGAIAERGRIIPMMVFIFCWATLVYCQIAYWAWNINGWAFQYGVMDFAGGGPVEIGSGFSVLAYSMVLGRRQQEHVKFQAHSVSAIFLGTTLLWFGWLGFNGGSAYGANLRAVMACWNTCLSAMFSAATWCILDFRVGRKWSLVGWCSGTIVGLVAATPACGFIPPWASVILGIVTAVISNYATHLKFIFQIDEPMDIFAGHGIPGIIGLVFNALFAATYITGLDGVNVASSTNRGGWLEHNYRQLYVQIAYIVAAAAYAFVVSAILAYVINKIPGLQLRIDSKAELGGLDKDQAGEFLYNYFEFGQEYLARKQSTENALMKNEDSSSAENRNSPQV